ncbi:MAG: Ig-like domain-containing protein [Saprospiraceae bacterium]|nr:Ig-like domain-containing protein [Saprospiraceae bacterium]
MKYKISIIKLHSTALWFFAIVFFGTSCANIRPISGGPEDKTAPGIINDKSSKGQTLHCKDRRFTFQFDEWITLNNPSQNIFILPSLKNPLITSLKGKSLQISIDPKDTLSDNTTYSIYFGDAIKDITNNNIASNLRYVFSTGDFIDSLSISGNVKDAFSNKDIEKPLVLLYSNLEDSAFKTSKPDYFVFGDKNGIFSLNNIKAGRYKLYGLIDKNQNYFYDQKTESIAFYDEVILLKESNLNKILLRMSEEKPKNFIKDKKVLDGRMRLIFTNSSEDVSVSCNKCLNYKVISEVDSLSFWYESEDTAEVVVAFEEKKDTIVLLPTTFKSRSPKTQITRYSRQLTPDQSIKLFFQEPIQEIDETKISFNQDIKFTLKIDSPDSRKLILNPVSVRLERLNLILKDSAVLGIHNAWNISDTLPIEVISQASLSRLSLQLDSVFPDTHYIIQILSNDKVIETREFDAVTSIVNLKFNQLFPGKYDARIIEDRNRNGKWDPSIFAQRIQAESVSIFSLGELRADWDLELKISMK